MAHENDERIVYAALIIFEKKVLKSFLILFTLSFVGRHVMILEYSLWHEGVNMVTRNVKLRIMATRVCMSIVEHSRH